MNIILLCCTINDERNCEKLQRNCEDDWSGRTQTTTGADTEIDHVVDRAIVANTEREFGNLKIYTTLGYIVSHSADDAKAKHVSQVQED